MTSIDTTSYVLMFVPLMANMVLASGAVRLIYGGWKRSCDKDLKGKKEKHNCNLRNPALPPGYVFSIMWLTLFMLIGVSWALGRTNEPQLATNIDILFGILTGLLFLWTVIFGTGQHIRMSIYSLFFIFIYTMGLWSYMIPRFDYDYLYLVPLICWEVFALIIGVSDISFYVKPQKIKKNKK